VVIDPGNLLTEIQVFDGNLQPVALRENLGPVEVPLSPGIYEVRFRIGQNEVAGDREVAIFPRGELPGPVTPKAALPFASPIPMPGTSTWNPLHQERATQLGSSAPAPSGQGRGSQLLLFVRDLKEKGTANPASGLTLHDLHGPLLDFSTVGTSAPDQGWAGCHLELAPATYVLRLNMGNDHYFERALPTFAGWMTQVFLLVRTHGGESGKRFADYSSAALVFTPLARPFDLTNERYRLSELARHALEGGRGTLGDNGIEQLTAKAEEAPLLGLSAAHLYLHHKKEPKLDRVGKLLDRVPAAWHEQSDYLALRSFLAGANPSPGLSSRPIELPPLLTASWKNLVPTSGKVHRLSQTGTVLEDVAVHVRSAGAWLVWPAEFRVVHPANVQRAPTSTSETAGTAPATSPLTQLYDVYSLLLGKLQEDPALVAQLAAQEDLTSVERRLAQSAFPLATPELGALFQDCPGLLKRILAEERQRQPPNPEQVLRNLALPASLALRGLRSLMGKLGLNVFFLRLQALIQKRSIEPVLQGCHRPCQRLVGFEDFTQDVLLRAVQNQDSFRGQTEAELLAWLRAIATQLMVNQLRCSRQCQTAPLPPQLADPQAPSADEQLAAVEEQQQQTERLVKLLATLTEAERDLLIRHHQGKEKLRDIAAELGIPANTLAQRHARLLNRLRQLRP
jgi:RNA polymerase sigma factor (sigma-70 family)